MATLEDKIPKILRERLLINEQHRKILKAMEDFSPKDSGNIYVPQNTEKGIPSIEKIASSVHMKPATVRTRLKEIKKVWNVPDSLPNDNGKLDEEKSLINALTNQHKLRWDPEIKDYRVPRIHLYNGELGTGTLYTNNKAFEGERIFRNAIGLNEKLNSVHFQGGIMPPVILMYGKLKNQRALLTGLNKTRKEPDEEELVQVKELLEQSQKKDLTPRQIRNLRDYVVNTIDSMEEAARSVAHELAPLLKDVPEHVPIHMYYSYNDDANLSELEDVLISELRKVHGRAKKAAEKLPGLYEDLAVNKSKLAQVDINVKVGNYILDYLDTKAGELAKLDDVLPTGKKMRTMIDEELFQDEQKLERLKNTLRKYYFRAIDREDEQDFERALDNARSRFYLDNLNMRDRSHIEARKVVDDDKKLSLESKVANLKDYIAELKQYEKALMAEAAEGHAWFTHKIAIRPTEAKANLMIEKVEYKDIYDKILIPTLKEVAGRDLDIRLHTDREISVFIEDPATLLEKNEYSKNKLYGTIVTSIPRTNRQRSNEPLKDSISELIKKHESAVASRLKEQAPRPKTVQDFRKRHCLAFSDVVFTSWGAEGYRLLPKFAIAPIRVKTEYRGDTETVFYLKLPTRHDMKKLSDLMKRGNRGTWEAKRLEKGGPTTGNVIQIIYPDRSQEWIFIDDNFYEKIADKYADDIYGIENKLAKVKSQKTIKKWQNKLNEIYAEINPDIYYSLLVNDAHLGSTNMLGRPTNVDVIKTTQQAALQSLGKDKIKSVAASEILHGNMDIGSSGYRTNFEGQLEETNTIYRKLQLLEQGLRKQGFSDKRILEHIKTYQDEQLNARSVFLPNQQKDMFMRTIYPVFKELLDNGTKIYLGSGNHWNQSHSEDEAQTLKNLFDTKYSDLELLITLDTSSGQGYSMDPIRLPGKEKGIDTVFTHKMLAGATEISRMMDQAVGNKEDALIYITADRHQPAVVAEKERYGVLDVGKQSATPYVSKIGKASSVRGTIALGYSPDRELMFSTRFWLDDTVDGMTGWKDRADMLKRCHDIIASELKKSYSN